MASPIASSSSTPSQATSLPHFYAHTPPQPPTQPQRAHTRLTPEGVKVQYDFFENVTQFPSKAQMEELVAQIRTLPGCESHTIERMRMWFNNRRQKHKERAVSNPESKPGDKVNLPSRLLIKTMYPSFEGPNTVKVLRELSRDHPNPTDDVLKLFAERLHATLEDLRVWLLLEKGKEIKPNVAELDAASSKRQLPTPQSTASPEPQEQDDSPPLKKLRTLANLIIEATPQPSADSPSEAFACPRVSSIAEFSERFAPYEAQFKTLLDTFDEGKFAMVSIT